MMKKLSALVFCVIVMACNSGTDSNLNTTEEKPVQIDMTSEISKLQYVDYNLDTKAKQELLSWTKFSELDNECSKLKTGDVSYFKNDAKTIVAFMKDLRTSIPEPVAVPSIEARLLTLETKMLKLQSVLSLNAVSETEQLQCIKEVLVAQSNLKLQINKKYEKESQNIERP